MWWTSFKVGAVASWNWVKKYWQIVVGFVSAILLYVLTRKTPDPTEILEKSNEAHDKELKAVKKAHAADEKGRKEAIKRQEKAVKEVERAFEEANKMLSIEKREEIKKVIEENADDPDAITEKLSELTGFKISDS